MRADRLLSLLLLLQTRGRMTAHDLAERLEVSERTIYRDLEALSIAGVPVYAERGPGGGCDLLNGYQTDLTGLNEAEVRAL
ncbi:MAG: HTH domain-containing protein, partial [Chloroflexota bacterium]|nr:HTH domain-containing protein [Chloroflexota bacterium]